MLSKGSDRAYLESDKSFYLSVWTDSISFKILLESVEMKGISLYLLNAKTIHF